MDNEEDGGRVLRFKYNDFTSILEHYKNNTFIATFDDELSKIRVLMSFLPDLEREHDENYRIPRSSLGKHWSCKA